MAQSSAYQDLAGDGRWNPEKSPSPPFTQIIQALSWQPHSKVLTRGVQEATIADTVRIRQSDFAVFVVAHYLLGA
jgi:hypothetical protein